MESKYKFAAICSVGKNFVIVIFYWINFQFAINYKDYMLMNLHKEPYKKMWQGSNGTVNKKKKATTSLTLKQFHYQNACLMQTSNTCFRSGCINGFLCHFQNTFVHKTSYFKYQTWINNILLLFLLKWSLNNRFLLSGVVCFYK